MEWFRWYHGTVRDDKLRLVAAEAGQPVANAIAVWAYVLERASTSDDRGSIAGMSPKLCAFALGIDTGAVVGIVAAMHGAELLVGDRVRNWSKRQPIKEDPTAAQRKRRQREIARSERDISGQSVTGVTSRQKRDVTVKRDMSQNDPPKGPDSTPQKVPDALGEGDMSRHVTLEEIRRDSKEEEDTASPEASPEPTALPVVALSKSGQAYIFSGKIIKLVKSDYDRWAKSFAALDLTSHLQALDDWLSTEAKDQDRKKWFALVSACLRKRHEAARNARTHPNGGLSDKDVPRQTRNLTEADLDAAGWPILTDRSIGRGGRA